MCQFSGSSRTVIYVVALPKGLIDRDVTFRSSNRVAPNDIASDVSCWDSLKIVEVWTIRTVCHAGEEAKVRPGVPGGVVRVVCETICRSPEAREVRCWHSERIPAPLQSEMYMLKQHESLLANSHPGAPTLYKQETRTKVFTTPNPPQYRVILGESSLHRMPGGRDPQLVADQVEHLLKLMESHPRLELRILASDVDVPWEDCDFQHLVFAGDEPPRICLRRAGRRLTYLQEHRRTEGIPRLLEDARYGGARRASRSRFPGWPREEGIRQCAESVVNQSSEVSAQYLGGAHD